MQWFVSFSYLYFLSFVSDYCFLASFPAFNPGHSHGVHYRNVYIASVSRSAVSGPPVLSCLPLSVCKVPRSQPATPAQVFQVSQGKDVEIKRCGINTSGGASFVVPSSLVNDLGLIP